jgi:hypothetical protein
MLTVEICFNNDKTLSKEVEIYFDEEGLDYLLDRLLRLKEKKTDHYNLMTAEWGEGELSSNKQRRSNQLANHVRLMVVES